MADDIGEVPMYEDIYDEHIPEMSSSYEASSFHTKRTKPKQKGIGSRVYDDNDIDVTVRSGEDIYGGSIHGSRANFKSFNKDPNIYGSTIKKREHKNSTLNDDDSNDSMNATNEQQLLNVPNYKAKPLNSMGQRADKTFVR